MSCVLVGAFVMESQQQKAIFYQSEILESL
jgi:hypothetical protein